MPGRLRSWRVVDMSSVNKMQFCLQERLPVTEGYQDRGVAVIVECRLCWLSQRTVVVLWHLEASSLLIFTSLAECSWAGRLGGLSSVKAGSSERSMEGSSRHSYLLRLGPPEPGLVSLQATEQDHLRFEIFFILFLCVGRDRPIFL